MPLNMLPKLTEIPPKEHRSGIYFLFDEEGRLLYIGKAADLRRRFHTHKELGWDLFGNKPFRTDKQVPSWLICFVSFVLYDNEDMNELEKRFIQEYKPLYNWKYNSEYYDPELVFHDCEWHRTRSLVE